MQNFVEYFVKRPITVVMGIAIIIVFGILSITRLPMELTPEMELPYVIVVTTYTGASPEEVENNATIPVENAIKTVSGFNASQSMSMEHFSMVFVEFTTTVSMDSVMLSISQNLDLINFEDGINRPQVIQMDPSLMPTYMATFSGVFLENEEGIDDHILTTEWFESEIVYQLEAIDGVASVDTTGLASTVLEIEFDSAVLDNGGTPLVDRNGTVINSDYLLNYIEEMNLHGLAGITIDGTGIKMLYIGNKIDGIAELKSLPISYSTDGGATYPETPNTLEDLATRIEYVDNSSDSYSKVNGANGAATAIMISFYNQSGANAVQTGANITAELDKIQETYADTVAVQYTAIFDQGDYISSAIMSIVTNVVFGALIAIVVLYFFLRSIKPTLIVGIAIPLSVISSLTLMYLSGISLNMISMGGLALGIGMLVDNAIVVIENIYRHLAQGMSRTRAAVYGAGRITGAIIASTLTTISVFIPVFFIDNVFVSIFNAMAYTVGFSLISSLVIAITVVPTIAAAWLGNDEDTVAEGKDIEFIEQENRKNTESKLSKRYHAVLSGALKHRTLVFLGVAVLAIVAVSFSTVHGVEMIPEADEGTINASVEIDSSVSFEDQSAYADFLFDYFDEDANKIEEIDLMHISLGSSMMSMLSGSSSSGPSFTIMLTDDRKKSTNEVAAELESKLLGLTDDDYIAAELNIRESDILEVEVSSSSSMSMGSSSDSITITGNDLDELEAIANGLTEELLKLSSVEEITSSIVYGDDVVRLTVDKVKATEAGVTVQNIQDSINLYYRWFGLDVSALTDDDTGLQITDNGVNYDVQVPTDLGNMDGLSQETFVGSITIFNSNMLDILNDAFDNEEVFALDGQVLTDLGTALAMSDLTAYATIAATEKPLYVPTINLESGEMYFTINPTLYYNGTSIDTVDTGTGLASLSAGAFRDTDGIVEVDYEAPGFGQINRQGNNRVATLTVVYKDGVNSVDAKAAIEDVIADYVKANDFSARIEVTGQTAEILELINQMVIAAFAAIMIVYMIMAIQFQSFKNPFIVLITIPLAFTGGILAVILTGQPLGLMSVVGLVVLIGIIVNNGIVLIDYINKCREKGMDLLDACVEASFVRLRPILMTALTTMLALSTIALDVGEGTEMLQPLAITTIGGLLYGTVLTLLVVPAMFVTFNNPNRTIGQLFMSLGSVLVLIASFVVIVLEGLTVLSVLFLLVAVGIVILVDNVINKRQAAISAE